MNINRQAGRRRGRGGQRQGGGGSSQGNNGNRIDNRARGNANQLYEKYKTLAADAQRQGDRVNTEYYLQFADHYFRVLAETRSRFEEQNPGQSRRPQDSFDDEESFDDDGNEVSTDEPRREVQAREPRDEGRGNRNNRDNGRDGGRDNNRDREDRGNRYSGNGYADNDAGEVSASDDREERAPREERQPREERAPREAREPRADREQPRRGRPRRDDRPAEAAEGETFDASLLPPSLGISIGDEGDAAAPKPRRRRARPTEESADAAE